MKKGILIGLVILGLMACKTPRDRVYKIGYQEGWVDETRFVVLGIGAQNYNNQPAKIASIEACRIAGENLPRRFSEFVLGGSSEKRCAGVDPATDSYCDWNYRLDPTVFTFKGYEVKRRYDFSSNTAYCEIAMEYRDRDLKSKALAYAARFNAAPPTQ